ncbi:hypothetical protein [Eggerthella timonensis]|nr:hypothetical protein [Eggerthella timonensis]
MDAIAKAYARRIERGAITLEDVPAAIRPLVEAALAAAAGKGAM